MKTNILLGLLVVTLGYVTCRNLRKTAEPSATTLNAPASDSESGGNFRASHIIKGDNPDTAGTRQVGKAPRHVDVPWDQTKPTTSRRAYMASGWWYATMAYQPSDTAVHYHFKDKWFKFKEDQSFEMYINGKVVDRGHWGYDDANTVMYISCNDPYYNNTWAVQERGFRMVWKGNTELNVTGIQVRMDNAPSPPWQN
jgi:hypothetical protein